MSFIMQNASNYQTVYSIVNCETPFSLLCTCLLANKNCTLSGINEKWHTGNNMLGTDKD